MENADVLFTNRLLIQVVPRLTPGKCGVADHAILLANQLKQAHGIQTVFIVLNSTQKYDSEFKAIYCSTEDIKDACLSVAHSAKIALLLHLSGYGYSQDGAPVRLARAISTVQGTGRFQIATYFHELYYKNLTPWKKAFWNSRRQKKSIAEQSNLLLTSIHLYEKWIIRNTARMPARPIHVMPVFSTIGEVLAFNPVANRNLEMIVFGLEESRKRSYQMLRGCQAMLRRLGIKSILDIGPGTVLPADIPGIAVEQCGTLSEKYLIDKLQSTLYGFTPYDPICVAKSSIFAAYCACGVIPLLPVSLREGYDGLVDGVQFLTPRTAVWTTNEQLQRHANAAWQWHDAHNVRIHALRYAQWMTDQSK
jgi:hypothetical protein